MIKRMLSILLTTCLLLTLLPAAVFGDDTGISSDLPDSLDISTGSITIENGTTEGTLKVTYDDGTTVDNLNPSTVINIAQADAETSTSNRFIVSANVPEGVNIKLNGVNIKASNAPFEIDANAGKVNLTLANGKSNKLMVSTTNYAALQKNNAGMEENGWLTITCEGASSNGHVCDDEICGRLEAFAGSFNGAGIGGRDGGAGSYISIQGGNITAVGGTSASGIGGGSNGSGSYINIYGGNISAASGSYASGIGGGQNRSGSYINIYGGNISAVGKSGGSGIGGGSSGIGSNITISGGFVEATGGSGGAGIGGGNGAKNGEDITIEGGIVIAVGFNGGAGIGGGAGQYNSSIGYVYGQAINITINGGTVTAISKLTEGSSGPLGCGIGAGGYSGSVGSSSNIKITGGNVYAVRGDNIAASSIGTIPKNNSNSALYRAIFTIPGDTTGGTDLDGISFTSYGTAYEYNMVGAKSILDEGSGKLFVYLPIGSFSLVYSGKTYTAWVAGSDNTEFELSAAKAIAAFNLNGLTPNVTGSINEAGKTIALTVPYGTDVTALVPTITHTGASISPDTNVAQNFTNPVTYTVTAENGSTAAYTVTVTVAPAPGGGSDGSEGGTPTPTPTPSASSPTPFPTPAPAIIVAEVQSELFTDIEDIVVEADVASAFGQTVEAKITDNEASSDEVFKLVGSDDTVYPFDISIYAKASGEKVQPREGHSVKITLPVPEKLLDSKENIQAVYVRDGKLVVLASQLIEKDGKWYITFEAVHFSPYALLVATPWTNPFSDVSESDWYYSAVKYAAQRGLMIGTGNHAFSPDLLTDRAMLVTILYKLSGSNEDLQTTFSDVAPGAYYAKAVAWAQKNSIISGYGNGKFGPEDSITREQLAVILWRYAGSPAVDSAVLSGLKDAGEIAQYAKTAMAWAYQLGILLEKADDIIYPRGSVTRAETAAILELFLKKEEAEF